MHWLKVDNGKIEKIFMVGQKLIHNVFPARFMGWKLQNKTFRRKWKKKVCITIERACEWYTCYNVLKEKLSTNFLITTQSYAP